MWAAILRPLSSWVRKRHLSPPPPNVLPLNVLGPWDCRLLSLPCSCVFPCEGSGGVSWASAVADGKILQKCKVLAGPGFCKGC